MPVLYYNNISIQLEEVQRTSPALKFLMGDTIYYASVTDVRPDQPTLHFKHHNGMIYHLVPATGIELVYEVASLVSNINRCITDVILQPGVYQVKVMGGRGGDGGGAVEQSNSPGFGAAEQICNFTITSVTNISVFRGGNGNNGIGGSKSGNATAPAGGGASGAPSAVIVNGEICKSEGGGGGRGGGGFLTNGSVYLYGRGAGGGFGVYQDGDGGFAQDTGAAFVVGGGGGGAPNGLGGAGYSLSSITYAVAGANAVGINSGGGGDAVMRNLTARGGSASQGSVQWSCGGHSLYSYGGGSAGGLVGGNKTATGGIGGSGVTTTMTDSYVRIYKVGDV